MMNLTNTSVSFKFNFSFPIYDWFLFKLSAQIMTKRGYNFYTVNGKRGVFETEMFR